ncbi:MAG: hypothetical protein EZS28_049222 [Streblomastix strix]|uniref:Uncharacterized protein n=1 Tax=Streblomastix strix TaxID=222440 RepID=A0A5J4TBE7_9EUKA|nr:MAG: hypothetical protein EZS28_049222 [Streblomastix strix]
MDTTKQGNLLKIQSSPVIRPRYSNQMLKSLRARFYTDGAHPVSVDTILARIVGFTGEFDQELKKFTAQQVIDMIRSKPEKISPERVLVELEFIRTNQSFYNQPPQQQIQGQQPLQYPFQYSGQPTQYPIQPVQFPIIPLSNPFLPTVNPPQTQMSEPRLLNNETGREQQSSSQPNQHGTKLYCNQLRD